MIYIYSYFADKLANVQTKNFIGMDFSKTGSVELFLC